MGVELFQHITDHDGWIITNWTVRIIAKNNKKNIKKRAFYMINCMTNVL